MKLQHTLKLGAAFFATSLILSCSNMADDKEDSGDSTSQTSNTNFGGYNSPEAWGKHIVTVSGCIDCHTPKQMTPQGPMADSSMLLSGYHAASPDIDVDRADMERKGLVVTRDLTEWIGPWGISYSANLTSDSTGIGGWKEDQFIYALREGKTKGLPQSRPILPPMPWMEYRHMTDDELKAVFAYLKSTTPVKNVVPPPKPPVSASMQQ